jgi:hypothetical protein
MDPNAALLRMRELAKCWEDLRMRELAKCWGDTNDLKIGQEMVDVFEALDQWISRGGFLPRDWERGEINKSIHAALLVALHEVEEFLDQRADVDDGIPNDAMRHLVEVRAAIAKSRT